MIPAHLRAQQGDVYMDTGCAQVSYVGATTEGILRVLEPFGRGSRPNRPRRRNPVSPTGEIRLSRGLADLLPRPRLSTGPQLTHEPRQEW